MTHVYGTHGGQHDTNPGRLDPGQPPAPCGPHRSQSRGPIIWAGLAGFVAGAVCWHMVGFWGFVSDAVLHRHGTTHPSALSKDGSLAKVQSRQTGTAGPVRVSLDTCATAAIDRTGGDSKIAGCEGLAIKVRPPRNSQRADLGDFGPTPVPVLISSRSGDGTAIGGWAARVEGTDELPRAAKPD
jgi:hypothetical protein